MSHIKYRLSSYHDWMQDIVNRYKLVTARDFLEMIDNGDRRYHFKGDYLWDIRYHADGRYNVPMGDIEETNQIISKFQGLGILIFDIHANSDVQKSFVEWHEELKGGPSSYTIQRESEGRRDQPRKTDYFIKKVFAYYFTSSDMQHGINDKWLKTSFQGGFRNSDGSSRKGKYMLDTRYIPPECLLLVKNFNECSLFLGTSIFSGCITS